MTQLDTTPEELPEEIPEQIVQWEPRHGRTFGLPMGADGAVVVAATVGALALIGITAGAYVAGRRSRRYDS